MRGEASEKRPSPPCFAGLRPATQGEAGPSLAVAGEGRNRTHAFRSGLAAGCSLRRRGGDSLVEGHILTAEADLQRSGHPIGIELP
jgi:hypothetical protein